MSRVEGSGVMHPRLSHFNHCVQSIVACKHVMLLHNVSFFITSFRSTMHSNIYEYITIHCCLSRLVTPSRLCLRCLQRSARN